MGRPDHHRLQRRRARGPGTRLRRGRGPAGKLPGPIDLNAATAEQLAAVPGIGPKTAEAIVALRGTKGGFKSVDELTEVKGIGPRAPEDPRRPLRECPVVSERDTAFSRSCPSTLSVTSRAVTGRSPPSSGMSTSTRVATT
ncbi:MAG: helix-hairpin-helix domain-containing protein [bacterium]